MALSVNSVTNVTIGCTYSKRTTNMDLLFTLGLRCFREEYIIYGQTITYQRVERRSTVLQSNIRAHTRLEKSQKSLVLIKKGTEKHGTPTAPPPLVGV